ncbi:hypothetical protein NGA84_03610 [Lactococcus formosensis]|uniref:Uncharacterized protein n=1 Tax=Lactococcus formosensis TaxID=1281486 RepID=A0A9X4P821_9LACT|nr:hypothetical protein [Lactococcus formosensis]MDG6142434.1 hypothetical protein [Lactococcus formosensis]MDG6159638.1 hypothetical protein [Lactococcus formosensis]MDG6165872.1 hypothetical protein [Lactococcus formosensis]MDG6172329.1 hypothetical protein [Lactococcus formosensis]MDG6193092.1 hypothetical protein [Lactococcus formosensis]
MTPDKKRKLRNIAILSLLGLIGGTFAFTAFNQQAINDRENDVQVNVGGRVHDYYNAETENKDVFVENYGERPIMARIRLSEFLEYQRGDGAFTQLVGGSERDNLESWTTWIPSETNVNVRANVGNSNEFNRYSNLRFGRAGEAPWYLPTFNHNNLDLSTAAAGDARDLADGSDDVTHPGDGTEEYWAEGVTYTNGSGPTNTVWHGGSDGATRETAQNLQQQRPVMTIQQWSELQPYQQIGDFWVVDHTTGWAYWASLLEPGEASSYLLDAAEMTAAIEDTVFNGSYYYGIHVDSQLISPDTENMNEFLTGGDSRLADFLTGIQNNAMDGEGSNPRADIDSLPSAFNFDAMLPGRVFTMDGVEYRYLEDMGNDNHMIIRNEAIRNTSFNDQPQVLSDFYAGLTPAVQAIVQPVTLPSEVPAIPDGAVGPWEGSRWLPAEWEQERFNEVRADRTTISGSTSQAFALSLADVVHLSTETGSFPNHLKRSEARRLWWWLRTPGVPGLAWVVTGGSDHYGQLNGIAVSDTIGPSAGIRPALIINQPN